MKLICTLFVFLWISCASCADVFPPMNVIYHPVSTTNIEAQYRFNRGLTYIFAFNHDLAFKEFEQAAKIDPNLAMAYWGMALAIGQNINIDITAENEKRAYSYIQKALSLSSRATPVEDAYINALSRRYTDDPNKDLISLRYTYRDAMKKVADSYPQDLDAACLYAESIMDLSPWDYWTWDGKPKEGTLDAIDVLANVLRRNPDHIGANHFYVHAWEASLTPERALMSAFRLTQLLPESGHLTHMPCHIFMLCGYYAEAIQTSKNAIAADRKYIAENGMGGVYPLHYLSHNIKVLVRAYMLAEDYQNAIRTAEELDNFVEPHFDKDPHLVKNMLPAMEVTLYFHRWNEFLMMKRPPIQYTIPQTFWHYGRALSFLNLGNVEGYQTERKLMQESKQKLKPDDMIANNQAIQVFDLANLLLDAAWANFNHDSAKRIEILKKAADMQDHFNYDEPPAWYISVRIELGKALLEENRYEEAEEAFKKSLNEFQRNGRILFGLYLSLKGQNRNWDTFWVEREMQNALRHGTFNFKLENL